MLNLLKSFSHIISSYHIYTYKREKNLFAFRARLVFEDDSVLEIKEYRFANQERKYAYHWMDKSNNLLIRWDNAQHWKDIATFPHHKHVSSKSNVQLSFEINLDQVLLPIERAITKNSNQC